MAVDVFDIRMTTRTATGYEFRTRLQITRRDRSVTDRQTNHKRRGGHTYRTLIRMAGVDACMTTGTSNGARFLTNRYQHRTTLQSFDDQRGRAGGGDTYVAERRI